MSSYLISIFLGLIQGITEFVPISSSGHLVLLHNILNFQYVDNLFFDVALHFGTLISLVIYFAKDIKAYIIGFVKNVDKNPKDFSVQLPILILVAMIPAIIIGGLWENWFEQFANPLSVSIFLIIGSVLFLIAEKLFNTYKDIETLDWKKSLTIGLFQVLAFFPGMSRSGITIITGMGLKLKRAQAARFTFLLAIPIIFAAAVKQLFTLNSMGLTTNDILLLLAGVVSSALFGFLAIKYLLRFLEKHRLNLFAYYRLALAAVILIWYLF